MKKAWHHDNREHANDQSPNGLNVKKDSHRRKKNDFKTSSLDGKWTHDKYHEFERKPDVSNNLTKKNSKSINEKASRSKVITVNSNIIKIAKKDKSRAENLENNQDPPILSETRDLKSDPSIENASEKENIGTSVAAIEKLIKDLSMKHEESIQESSSKSAGRQTKSLASVLDAPVFEPESSNLLNNGHVHVQPVITSTGQVLLMTENGLMFPLESSMMYGYNAFGIYPQPQIPGDSQPQMKPPPENLTTRGNNFQNVKNPDRKVKISHPKNRNQK